MVWSVFHLVAAVSEHLGIVESVDNSWLARRCSLFEFTYVLFPIVHFRRVWGLVGVAAKYLGTMYLLSVIYGCGN
jgi:hypothetical protein